MKQAVLLIDCYLYGTIAILAVVLLVLVYLHGQANHLPNPFVRKNIIYRPAPKARGVLLGQKYGLLAYSPERDEGHIIVMGPSGTGKTIALLIPTLRSWQGTALVVDISGDISANVDGRVFGIQIFVRDPDYNMDTQSAASDTSAPVEIAAVVVTDSATTETATK